LASGEERIQDADQERMQKKLVFSSNADIPRRETFAPKNPSLKILMADEEEAQN